MVVDRQGQLLVDSRPSFDLLFVAEDAEEPESTLRQLAGYLRRDEKELLATLEENKKRPAFEEIVIGKDVDWATVVAVETHQIDLPGVSLRARPRRSYSDGPVGAHILGYLGEIGPKQLKTLKDQGYATGDEFGQYGLEKTWEYVLRGQSGGQQVEVDALGRRVRVLHEVTDVPGYTVHLTLDRQLQETAFEALKGKEGTIVALDVNTGAILTMVSTPAFDPNVFARGIKSEEWQGLMKDRLRPLSNRAIQGQYPPGSTFKVIMAIAGLEEGCCNPKAEFPIRVTISLVIVSSVTGKKVDMVLWIYIGRLLSPVTPTFTRQVSGSVLTESQNGRGPLAWAKKVGLLSMTRRPALCPTVNGKEKDSVSPGTRGRRFRWLLAKVI